MSYRYIFSYGTCEESETTTLVHESRFSKKEIEEFYAQAFEYALKKKLKEKEVWAHELSFQRLYKSAISWLKKQGFRPEKYQSAIAVFGWAKANEPGDWGTYAREGSLTRRLQERLSNYSIHDDKLMTIEKLNLSDATTSESGEVG